MARAVEVMRRYEFSSLIGGARPDFVTFKSLNHRIQDGVPAEAEIQYAEG